MIRADLKSSVLGTRHLARPMQIRMHVRSNRLALIACRFSMSAALPNASAANIDLSIAHHRRHA